MTDNGFFRSRIDFAAFCLLAVVGISLAALAYSFGGVDFGVYYAAGRVLLKGGNPYEYGQLAGEIVSSTGELNNPFYYAPWFAWGMSLLAVFPYQTARAVWALLNFIFWFWSLRNLSELVDWNTAGWRRWGSYLFVTVLFAWSTWGSEQVGVLILLLVTLALRSYLKGNLGTMGVWLALLLFKPNITAFPVFLLTVWLAFRRDWKPIAWMGAALLGMIAVSLAVTPGWYLALLQPDKLTGLSYTLNESGEVQIPRYSSTLLDWLAAYGVSGTPAYVFYALVALCGLWISARLAYSERSAVRLAAYSLLVNFALVPYALFYDYASLTLTLFFINLEFAQEPSLAWAQRLMNGLVFASLFVGGNISYRYWIVVILAFFAALRYFLAASRAGKVKGGVTSS